MPALQMSKNKVTPAASGRGGIRIQLFTETPPFLPLEPPLLLHPKSKLMATQSLVHEALVMLSQALWFCAAYGSFTKGRKEICILIKLSIVKTFFLLYLFKTRRTECNEGFLSSLGRRHHPFPCIHRHGPKETPNTEGARAPWSPRLSRTYPFPGTGSETRTAPANFK